MLSMLSNIGLTIFVGLFCSVAYKVYSFVTFYFYVPKNPLQAYKRQDGTSWALISGSSGGIGYALAYRLLSLGFGVIIFAHEGVEQAEAELRKAYPNGQIKAFTFNCMTASVPNIQKLVAEVTALPITILINNVGSIPMSHPSLRPFVEFDPEGIDGTIDLNSRFMTHLSRLMIPHLKANAAPRSLIINISSGGRIGMPYIAVYCATKAYNAGFSASLTREFKHFGLPIDCLCIVPGDVRSTGNRLGVLPNAPLAKQFAEEIVGRVDEAVRRDMVEVSPYWKHALQILALDWMPESIVAPELAKVMKGKVDAWEKEL